MATCVNFKCKASGVSKTGQNWEQKPKVFDSKGTPISKDILTWGGTMKVTYEIIPYSNNMLGNGVSLRLKAVQVHELVSGGDADSYGFKEEANGYVAETVDSFPEAEVNGQEDFKFRSGLEEAIADELDKLNVDYGYEDMVISYLKPARKTRYTPDFTIKVNGEI